MPGVFGVVDSNGGLSSLELPTKMADILRHDRSYHDYLFTSEHCVMGGSTPPYFNAIRTPAVNREKTLCVVMEGEIFNSVELHRELRTTAPTEECRDAAGLVLRLYEVYGLRFIDKVNGIFSIALWDASNRLATLITDRLGVHYIYYTVHNNRLVFGPEMKALLCDSEIKKSLDRGAIADFLTFGCVLGTKSFVPDIKLVPPGSIGQYKNGTFTIRKYWNFPFQNEHKEVQGRCTADYIEALDHVFDRAIKRQTEHGPRLGIALSGGLDSRMIAGYVGRTGKPVRTFTFGDPTNDDVIFAERAARIIQSSHQPVTYNAADFAAAFDKTVWLAEGVINTSEYYYLGRALGDAVDVAYSGDGGDVLSGRGLSKDVYTAPDTNSLREHLFDAHSRRVIGQHDPKALFSPHFYEGVREITRASFYDTFTNIETQVPANVQLQHAMLTKVWRDSTRVTNLPWFYVRYRYPFFDHEVLDFFLQVPPSLRWREKLYRGLLLEKFPALANIPYPNRRVSLRQEARLRAYYALRNHIGRFMLGRCYRLLRRFSPPESDVLHNVEAYRGPLRTLVWSLIAESNRQRGYFNQDYLEKLLFAHFERRANHSFLMHKLITLELFQRMFIDSSQLVAPAGRLL